VPITCETIKYKGQELSMSHIITQQHFKVSMHWYVAVVDEQVLSSQKNFTLLEIASRLQGEACCFLATCDVDFEKQQLCPELGRKCQ
jgi:biotin carboxylase